MQQKYKPNAVRYAVEQSKKDGKALFELLGQDKSADSKLRNKMRNDTKPIEIEVLQSIIDRYPKFLDYLEEYQEPTAAAGSIDSQLAELQQKFDRLADAYTKLADDKEVARKYIALLEKIASGDVPAHFNVRGLLDEQ